MDLKKVTFSTFSPMARGGDGLVDVVFVSTVSVAAQLAALLRLPLHTEVILFILISSFLGLVCSCDGEYVISVTGALRYSISPKYQSSSFFRFTVCTAFSLMPFDWA